MTDDPDLNYGYFRMHVREAIGPSERLDELSRGYSDSDLIFAIQDMAKRISELQEFWQLACDTSVKAQDELVGARSALGEVIKHQRETIATMRELLEAKNV